MHGRANCRWNRLPGSPVADIVAPEIRSRMMSNIRGKDTVPELLIRKALHRRGYRYLLHDRRLPGKPDLYFPKRAAVVQVNGCFWHGHDCPLFRWPATRREFWREKIGRTQANDHRNATLLEVRGLRVATVWECALRGKSRLPMDDVADELAAWLKDGIQVLDIRGIAAIERKAV